MRYFKDLKPYTSIYLLTLLLISCNPLNRSSHADFVWYSAINNQASFSPIQYINTFPNPEHFNTVCNWHIDYLKSNYTVPTCMLNARECIILSEDSISFRGSIYHFKTFNDVVYKTLQKGMHPKLVHPTLHSTYSDVYFVFNATQNKEDLQWWIYQTNAGVKQYADSLYLTVKDSSNLSFKDLNTIYTTLSNRVLFAPYLNLYPPKPSYPNSTISNP